MGQGPHPTFISRFMINQPLIILSLFPLQRLSSIHLRVFDQGNIILYICFKIPPQTLLSNLRTVILFISYRLTDLWGRSGEFCVYKVVVSHPCMQKIRNSCLKFSQTALSPCFFNIVGEKMYLWKSYQFLPAALARRRPTSRFWSSPSPFVKKFK